MFHNPHNDNVIKNLKNGRYTVLTLDLATLYLSSLNHELFIST